MLHRPMLAGLFEMGGNGLVPAEQHADYLSPPPKFHPVPTRPVFEPLPTYGGPLLLDAGAVRTHYSP